MDIFISFIIAMGLNILMFIPAYIFKTDKLTDLSYGISFALVAVILFFQNNIEPSKLILLVMLLLWSVRIGLFLFIRINRIKRDKRFDGIREYFFKFLGFWLLQGITVWLVLLPSVFFFIEEDTALTSLSYVGIAIWAFGLTIETVADIQKFRFTNTPKNRDKWIATGLWKYSRHPNYFGEITHWIGIYLFAVSSVSPLYVLFGLVSPLYIALLIIFVSGIPKLEKYADTKWGNDTGYRDYKKRTSMLLLLPNKGTEGEVSHLNR